MLFNCPVTCDICREAEEDVMGPRPYSVDDPDADHHGHAVDMDEDGDIKGAIASFQALVKFEPQESSNWHNLGTAIMSQLVEGHKYAKATPDQEANIVADAVKSFQQAVTLDPTNEEAVEALESLRSDWGLHSHSLMEDLAEL
jgi:Flp pilus assembly protein TadD